MDELLAPVLPVDNSTQAVDTTRPPSSGLEYLKQVKSQSSHTPDVIVGHVDPSKIVYKAPSGRHRIPKLTSCQRAPEGFAPSKEWQSMQCADFSDVRIKLARYKARLKKSNRGTVINPKEKKCHQHCCKPRLSDEIGWCRFCHGSRLSVDALRDTEQDQEAEVAPEGRRPFLSLLVSFDQKTVQQLLTYHVSWFSQVGFSVELGRWIYSLLVCLEKPIDSDIAAVLRNLAEQCSSLRASLDSIEHPDLTPMNLFICLVARYFQQYDLADEEKEEVT